MPSHREGPPVRERLFLVTRIVLSLAVGFLIAWVVGSATWNVWGVPGVPFIKGIIIFSLGMVGYVIMDRRIMGVTRNNK